MNRLTNCIDAHQSLLPLKIKLQPFCEETLTKEQLEFYKELKVIENAKRFVDKDQHMGRPAYPMFCFRRAFLALHKFRLTTVEDLRKKLTSDTNLRLICGFSKVPSLSTFCRRIDILSSADESEQIHEALVTKNLKGKIILHINRDSTAIETRERATNSKRSITVGKTKKYKRGRPKKGEVRKQEMKPVEKQVYQSARFALARLPNKCQWGGKKNSQGNTYYWKGRKLHLDVTDTGIPVTAVITGAGVHDSQVAIPMEKITAQRCSFCYSLMDAGYYCATIDSFIKSEGRIPIIEPKRNRNGEIKELDPAKRFRYRIRTTVERSNANLKDWLIPTKLCVRKTKNIDFILKNAVVLLTAQRLLSNGLIAAA
jgi:transposase